ncbi:HpcH/HpaI aldolase/citrate lyase family protein [Pantoea ananatis]|uniref:HpcH/HpaI aldolase/citrate lyase family protein n=1 Tax=Pantoea ananas TaxID=553 RepID=UPI00035D0548|nr:aldolase/citrate lyase family protein [Pantoea ananatis]
MNNKNVALYASGAKAGHLEVALESDAPYLVLCLEDGTPENKKGEARHLVKQAIMNYSCNNKICCVRINGSDTEHWEKDIEVLFTEGKIPDRVRIPMAKSVLDIQKTVNKIEALQNLQGKKYLEIMVENKSCFEELSNILTIFSEKIAAITVGGEDLLESVGRPEEALEIRKEIIRSCKEHSVPCLETTYMDYRNFPGLIADTHYAMQLGFSGRSVVHPAHVKICEEIINSYV